MKKNIYVMNENNSVDSYIVDIDEERINKIIEQMELETNKGELIHLEGTNIPYSKYKGKKVEVFFKKRIEEKTIVLDRDFGDELPYYKFSFYAYKENRIVKLAKKILSEENSLNLSSDIAKLFNEYYKLAESEKHGSDELFLLEIINSIKFKNQEKINNKKVNKFTEVINSLVKDDYEFKKMKERAINELVEEYDIYDYNGCKYSKEQIQKTVPQKKLMF